MKEAASNIPFEEAARLRHETRRPQAVELAGGDDPLARQEAIEAEARPKGGSGVTRRRVRWSPLQLERGTMSSSCFRSERRRLAPLLLKHSQSCNHYASLTAIGFNPKR